MVATMNQETRLKRIEAEMQAQYGAWLSEKVADGMYRFANRHQLFFVRVNSTIPEVYTFHETLDLNKPK